MQRICIELTRFYSQSAKCVYSSLPITSDVQSSKFSSLNFHENISKKKHNVNIRGVSTNIAPAVEKEKQWVKIKFIKADGNIIEAQGKKGDSLLDILNNNNIHIEGFGACEGTLACSTCHVIFKEDDYKRLEFFPGDEEQDMLDLASGLTDLKAVRCISLAGSGFLGLYLIGAAEFLQQQFPFQMENMQFAGSSAGALVASGMVCHVPLKEMRMPFLQAAANSRELFFGSFSSGFKIQNHLRMGLSLLPDNAHHLANGKLHISVTRAADFKNVIYSHWESRDELIDTILCSCFIPGFSGAKYPSVCGIQYIDGGFSNCQPAPFHNTLTISPFTDCANICPKTRVTNEVDTAYGGTKPPNLFVRYYRSLMPLEPCEMLSYCYEGYTDAKYILLEEKILSDMVMKLK